MDGAPMLTPEQQQQVQALLLKYPDLAQRVTPGHTGKGLNLGDPAVKEYLALNNALGLEGGYGINPKTGEVEQRGTLGQAITDAAKYSAAIAGGVYGATAIAGAAPTAAAGYGGVPAPTLGVSGTQAVNAAGTISPSIPGASLGKSILSRVGSKDFLTGAADVLGGAAKSASANNAINDANRVNLYNSTESQRLARDKFALDAPGTRMGQSAKASILSRVAPTKINWGGPGSGLRGEVPTTTGGYTDGLKNMDPMVGQLAQTIMQQNLAKQQANQDGVTVTPPTIGKSSIGDKALGIGAFGTSILSLLRR